MSIINSFLDTMASLASQSGFAGFLVDGGWKNIVMILISFVFMYLAIAKGFEPLLLLPISFGMLLTNLPYAEMYHPDFWNYKTVAGNDHYIDYGQILQRVACWIFFTWALSFRSIHHSYSLESVL